MEFFLAVVGVQRTLEPAIAIVVGKGNELALPGLVVDSRVAVRERAVDAQARGVVLAEAPAQVEARAELAAAVVVQGNARQRFVGGTLGHQVDGAAQRAGRRHAGEQCRRPAQQFHALEHFDRRAAVGRHAVHAADGQFVLRDGEVADAEVLERMAGRGGKTDRGIVAQHVGDGARALVLDGVGGIAGDGERRIHDADVAHQAQPCALGNLAACVGRRQCACAALHQDRAELRGRRRTRQGHAAALFRIFNARALQQLPQRLFRRDVARNGGRGNALHQILRIEDLQGCLPSQLQQGLSQRLGRQADLHGGVLRVGSRRCDAQRQGDGQGQRPRAQDDRCAPAGG